MIEPVYDKQGVTIYHSHSIFVLMSLPENSVDSIVTDPPYGLSFMGKKWDYDVPSVQLWREALRVLKPGGHLLSFAGSRTYHRMAVNIEDAGFEIRDQIMWIYGSGFPKSLDISKAIDKTDIIGTTRERCLKFTAWMRSTGITAKEIDDATNSNMSSHYLTDKQQPAIATMDMYEKLKHLLPEPPDEIMQLIKWRTVESENMKKRKVIGKQEGTNTKISSPACPISAQGVEQSQRHEFDITAPATPDAIKWDGWGTALKPAHEPIVVARKPLIGTVAENVLKHGTGGINIDGGRIGEGGDKSEHFGAIDKSECNIHEGGIKTRVPADNSKGRFPANIILDPEAGVMLDKQSGESVSIEAKRGIQSKGYTAGIDWEKGDEQTNTIRGHNDSGGASRFFYCAKASKQDRDEGLEGMAESRHSAMGYERGLGDNGEGMFKDRNPLKRNSHPTVKPTALMQYLVRLVTPPGGIVLDPFMGSGSTGKAAVREGFKFIGSEREAEYIPISIARINAPAQVELL